MRSVECRIASIDEIFALRHSILRAGKPLESAVFDIDHLAETLHFAAENTSKEIVACATLTPNNLNGEAAWQLRGMAVGTSVQGQGIGSLLLEFIENQLAYQSKSTIFWCNARERAYPFYLRNGWEFISDEFEIPGIGPHKKMKKCCKV